MVIDSFLRSQLADGVLREFPDIEDMPRSRDYIFGNKKELSSVRQRGSNCAILYDALVSPQFQALLREITDMDVFVDPAFHGGGFHQGGDGSFLDPHVDFNVHPLHNDWLRRLNILLYLSEGWQPEFGGELLLGSTPDGPWCSVEPRYNRCLLMLTGDYTFHGYRKMSLPRGVTRKSIATYAYETMVDGSVAPRTTTWAPVGRAPIKRIVARYYNPLVHLKNRFFGSSTSRNR